MDRPRDGTRLFSARLSQVTRGASLRRATSVGGGFEERPGFAGARRASGGLGGPWLGPPCWLSRFVPDLVEVAGAVSVQAWPPAEAAEVPGLEALTMIGSRRSVDLRSVAGDEHEAPAARRGVLHVDVNDVVFVHGLLSFHPDRHGRRYVRLRASAMPDRKPLIFREVRRGAARLDVVLNRQELHCVDQLTSAADL